MIFYSDQGGEYTGNLLQKACDWGRVRQPMGRTGSALDNAVAGAFNSTLEFELLAAAGRFATRAQARPGRRRVHRRIPQRQAATRPRGGLSPAVGRGPGPPERAA
jgi:transposase InsO family protein